jgi:hypothetical protein
MGWEYARQEEWLGDAVLTLCLRTIILERTRETGIPPQNNFLGFIASNDNLSEFAKSTGIRGGSKEVERIFYRKFNKEGFLSAKQFGRDIWDFTHKRLHVDDYCYNI